MGRDGLIKCWEGVLRCCCGRGMLAEASGGNQGKRWVKIACLLNRLAWLAVLRLARADGFPGAYGQLHL